MTITIRPAYAEDADAILAIIMPTIAQGETYTLDRDMKEADALAYWLADDKHSFVAQDETGTILGTYYLRQNQGGGGRGVCNCGYMTSALATGRGIARAMCLHSLDLARAQGFYAMQFNFVVSTNKRAVALWQHLGFDIVGRLPGAFEHPIHGKVNALVMYQTL
jgi:L-amino acid N-acyltransferase YncA